MKTENFKEEIAEVKGVLVRVTTYKIGENFYCHVYNVDPGATIARSTAATREKAVEEAMLKVTQRIRV
ncbi:MAG TPA: hypothetical protein VN763_05160 [Saprospiraceae bacterium]|nr:hypothetical protein [Saprospiraceae bacterium]